MTAEKSPGNSAPGHWDRLKRRDPLAFRAFVVEHERAVFALLSRITGRGAHVEDLAQETFLKAYGALPSFDPDGPARLSTWLLTIATRTAIDEKRRTRFPATDRSDETAHASRSPEGEALREELGRAIERAAALLPEDQRAALVLAEFHGFSMQEIGVALDVSEATAKTRLFRAREKMRAELRAFRLEEAKP